MLVTYHEKIQVQERGCVVMMETDLINSMWHLCFPWITGLGSEALQWETQLQFFNEHWTTLSFDDSFSGSTACCVFSFGNLTWSLSGPFPIKQGSLSSFMILWKDLVSWLEWIHQCETATASHCLAWAAIPSKGFLRKGNKGQVWVVQEGSGICSTESTWIRLTS